MVTVQDSAPAWLRAACAFIESNAVTLVTLTDIASAVKVPPEQLVRGFDHWLGFTPGEYIEDVFLRGAAN